jgi:hypothetical protein
MNERESNEAADQVLAAIRRSEGMLAGMRRVEAEQYKRDRRNQRRRDREQAMRDLGLTKVRGNCGGTYWE